jgi:NADH dehydrogenase (ubiquinone) 1 beta subcomplex subunit 8
LLFPPSQLHEQEDILSVWAPDLHETVKPTTALFQLGVMASAIACVASVIYYFTPERPALPRTYPRDGLAQELGNPIVAAYKEGDFDAKNEEEEEDDE